MISSPKNRRSIVITGGGRGIGRAIALYLKEKGYLVCVSARSESDLKETQSLLNQVNELPSLAIPCDVRDPKKLEALYSKAEKDLGSMFGLVCAAGVYGSIGPFVETEFKEWEEAIDINLKGTALSIHQAFPFLKRNGFGKIVLFSGGGQGPLANFSPYVTSKGGIWRLTETLGAELAPHRIFINAVAPGAVNTKLLDDLLAAGPEKVGKEFYQKSIAQKESGGQSATKASELTEYLLSERSDGLWGKTLSALWDPYRDFPGQDFKSLEEMSRSDIYQVRRVVDDQGGTRAK